MTQGDPAGIGPELLLRLVARRGVAQRGDDLAWRPLLLAERAALAAVRELAPAGWERLRFVDAAATAAELPPEQVAVIDPVGATRRVRPGASGPEDAAAAVAALDAGVRLARAGEVAALVTLPVSKESIARHLLPDFRGHTDYLAAACGLGRYGRDYLMAFLAGDLKVALLTVHLPLRQALDRVTPAAVLEALRCLVRHGGGGTIALAGLNPHAGEGGLLGSEEQELLLPAIGAARAAGIDVRGPESADSIFARAQRGAADWVLALYHDQGLIAVKTAAWGQATNWTLGLPFLRTSVDHGTAFDIAGRGEADVGPLEAVIETTLGMVEKRAVRHEP